MIQVLVGRIERMIDFEVLGRSRERTSQSEIAREVEIHCRSSGILLPDHVIIEIPIVDAPLGK
jgi:hypothetical protein